MIQDWLVKHNSENFWIPTVDCNDDNDQPPQLQDSSSDEDNDDQPPGLRDSSSDDQVEKPDDDTGSESGNYESDTLSTTLRTTSGGN